MNIIVKFIDSIVSAADAFVNSMPFNGDKVEVETMGGSTSKGTSVSPVSGFKRPVKPADYAQNYRGHATGNPPGATRIVAGGMRPMNTLHRSKDSGVRNAPQTSPQTSASRRKPRPGQAHLQFASGNRERLDEPQPGRMRTKQPSSPYEDRHEDDDYDSRFGGNIQRGDPIQMSIKGRNQESKSHLNSHPLKMGPPQNFSVEIEVHHDALKPALEGQKLRSGARSGDPGITLEDEAAEAGPSWDVSSTSDPRKTTFSSTKARQTKSSPIPVSRGRPSTNKPGKSSTSLHLERAGRAPCDLRDLGMIIRRDSSKLYVTKSSDGRIPNFDILFEDIAFAAYTDAYELRNYICIKVKHRINALSLYIIFQFRALPEPANSNSELDSMEFREWLKEKRVKIVSKPDKFFKEQLAELEEHRSSPRIVKDSLPPWALVGPPRAKRVATPNPRPQDNRPRTRSQLDVPETDSVAEGLFRELEPSIKIPTEKPVRRSTRSSLQKEVIEIPKPKPHPPQVWAQSLKYPFNSNRRELLDSSSLRTLDADQFLNDEIINFHLGIIRERLAKENPEYFSKVHLNNTYLYNTYYGGQGKYNYSGVKRWNKNVDIFEKDLVFFPINEKFHWFLAVVCNLPAALAKGKARAAKAELNSGKAGEDTTDELVVVEPKEKHKSPTKKPSGPMPTDECFIVVLDSMGSSTHPATSKVIKNFLIEEANDKKNIQLIPNDFTGRQPRKLPGQDNFSDCGLFMLQYIESWIENPSQIKQSVYQRDFGTAEDARKLWKVHEVPNKRERMWRYYVKLHEEYEKFLRNEPYDEYPKMEDISITEDKPYEEENNHMDLDRPASSPHALETAKEEVKRFASPAKRKSDGCEEDDDLRHRTKRVKSDSPVIIEERMRPKAPSPEIPDPEDYDIKSTPEVTDEAESLAASKLENSNIPLVAANGILPSHDNEESQEIVIAEFYKPHNPSERRPTTLAIPNGLGTPSISAAASFGDLSIDSSTGNSEEPDNICNLDNDGDTTMGSVIEEIEDEEDNSNVLPTKRRGKPGKGKPMHELADDRIEDDPSSSQDHGRPRTPRKQGTANDPIVLDSQSSPKRTSSRFPRSNSLFLKS